MLEIKAIDRFRSPDVVHWISRFEPKDLQVSGNQLVKFTEFK